MANDTTGGMSGKIVNFIFGSVLAGLVTTSFTYLSWREQTQLDLANKRLAEATTAFDKASQLISAQIFSSYDVARHIGDADDAYMKRREKLEIAKENWNLAYPDALQRFQFALEIDEDGRVRPFREIRFRKGDLEEHLDCSKAFDETNRTSHADWNSPSWLLAALDYCFTHPNLGLESYQLAKEKPARDWTKKRNEDRYEKLVANDAKLDNLQARVEQVRVAGKTAIQRLHHGAETRGFAEFLQGR